MLAKVIGAKTEVRRGLLKRHMQTLDESEGLQDVTTRLSDRLGIGEGALSSRAWLLRSGLLRWEEQHCRDCRVSGPQWLPQRSAPAGMEVRYGLEGMQVGKHWDWCLGKMPNFYSALIGSAHHRGW